MSGEAILSVENSGKPLDGRGSAPNPTGRSQRSPRPLAGGEGAYCSLSQGAPSFSTFIFHDFSMTKKMKVHDLSAQDIFPSKRYTTYECIPELVVTVPSARSTMSIAVKNWSVSKPVKTVSAASHYGS